jgi:hypothetical protein
MAAGRLTIDTHARGDDETLHQRQITANRKLIGDSFGSLSEFKLGEDGGPYNRTKGRR